LITTLKKISKSLRN